MKKNFASASRHIDAPDDPVGRIKQGEAVGTDTARAGSETGELALMRAVLQDAILCVQGHATGVARRDLQQAAAKARIWINARDLTWPFSFESICHVLGLDPDCLRGWLLRESRVTGDGGAPGKRSVWYEGGMVTRLRAVRMRGNQRKRQLTARRYRQRSVKRPRQMGDPQAAVGGSEAIAAW